MAFYSQKNRGLEVIADIAFLVWCVLWAVLGRVFYWLVYDLAEPSRSALTSVSDFGSQLDTTSSALELVPGLGSTIAKPFDSLSTHIADMTAALEVQIASIEKAAILIGWVAFIIPVAGALVIWIPRRFGHFFVSN